MNSEIVLTLPTQLYKRMQQWSTLTQQDLSQTVADALESAFIPWAELENAPPISNLPDDQLLALTTISMTPNEGERLDFLQEKQQDHPLTQAEQQEYQTLLQTYHYLWLRQSQALAEAVQRGLRPPMNDVDNF